MLFLPLLALVSSGLCLVLEPRDGAECPSLENDQSAVDFIVNDYASLIGDYSDALGNSFLADDFTDTSGSINALAGLPLDSVTFPSKAAFQANQASQPKIPLEVVSVPAVTCDTIVIRWTQQFGQANQLVAGISVLVLECNGGKWQLKTLFVEFNSLSYFLDIGGTITPPSS